MTEHAPTRSSRTVKRADDRVAEILDVAETLFYERGYDRTPISAIIGAIGIAKGTFYHHFGSKQELLDALVQRLSTRALELVRPQLTDENLSAVEKLRTAFSGLGEWKTQRRRLFLPLMRALYKPENTALRLKGQRASLSLFAPTLEAIIAQGIDEGSFDCGRPDVMVRMMFSLSTDFGEHLVGHLLADEPPADDVIRAEIDAYNDAINRLLGAAPNTVQFYRWEQIRPWLKSM